MCSTRSACEASITPFPMASVSAETLAIVVMLGNFALRFLTNKPLAQKKRLLT